MKKIIATTYLLLGLCACQPVSETEIAWQLQSGQPPYADPEPIVYSGEVELKGWGLMRPAYVGEESAHFHVTTQEKIPEHIRGREFQILADQALIDQILASGPESPLEVLATEIRVNIEGSPRIQIDRVL